MASIKRIGKDKLGIPIWNVYYRRTRGGKKINRHIHAATRADVERQILLDCQRSDIGLKWSEGLRIFLDAKKAEERNPEAMGHAVRAVSIFTQIIGDVAIEQTSAEMVKDFLRRVSQGEKVKDANGREYTTAGPKVANHHRKELLTVARYLLKYSGKISVIPFEHVPPLPAKPGKRSPVPRDQVTAYIDALPPHTRRPVLLVLLYGLRSTAVCKLDDTDSIRSGHLIAVDKGGVTHRIPIDETLADIITEARAFRKTFEAMDPDKRKPGTSARNLFLNMNGRGWTRTTLLHAAQRAWKRAGLEEKKIHEIRHTLGTLAGKNFTKGIVQAVMRHRSAKSSEVYFHPDEDMATEARQKIMADLWHSGQKLPYFAGYEGSEEDRKKGGYTCPCCSCNLLIINKKTRKPLRPAGYEILERAKGIEPS